MEQSYVDIFKALFAGADGSHGVWHPKAGPSTKREGATNVQWQNHLDGVCGLGQVPVRSDGTCVFAAIDIDVDDIDHVVLAGKIKDLGLPLHTCRSKSGGAHCYLFIAPPGKPATIIRKRMAQYASALGYAKAEIFPKQDKLQDGSVGNWINLPYFDGDSTTRMLIDAEGKKYNFTDFLATVQVWPHDKELPLPFIQQTQSNGTYEGMPPCLETLMANGIPNGQRNNGLFDFGVYFRKAGGEGDGWAEQVFSINYQLFKPPLASGEVNTIVKSLRRKAYEYLCKQEPIVGVCNKAVCLTRKYGIGKDDMEEAELVMGQIKKILTEPPMYRVEIYGIEITLENDQLTDYKTFRNQVFAATCKFPPMMKQKDWETLLETKMGEREEQDAPDDASQPGRVKAMLHRFLKRHEKADSREDLLKGLPVKEDDQILFRGTDFQEFLKATSVGSITSHRLWTQAKEYGCTHTVLRVKGKSMNLWAFPAAQLEEQTEGFEVKEPPPQEF